MRKKKTNYLVVATLAALLMVLLVGSLTLSTVLAGDERIPYQVTLLVETDFFTPTLGTFPTNTVTPTPEPTNALNLPIVQQEAPLLTGTPPGQFPLPSQTMIPIPPQPPEVNAPIVFGAIVIVSIIILAWFFIGRHPFNKGN